MTFKVPRVTAALALLLALPALRPRDDAPLTQLREIAAPSRSGAGQQNLAADADGRVYLSWVDRLPDSSTALRFAVLGGSAWSQPRTVAQGRDWFINWADFPSVVPLGGRSLAAHWLQRSSLGRYSYDVKLSRSADGGVTWTAPVSPHRDATPTEHGFAALWPMAGGHVGVVWTDGRKHALPDTTLREMSLRWNRLSPRGELAADEEVDTRICDCCQTAAALTADGPIVVYRDRSPDEIRDIGVVRLVNGSWTAPRTVNNDGWQLNACPVNGPAVAAEGRRAVVAWFTGADNQRRVKVAFSSDAGATFGEPVAVDDGNPGGRVQVLLLENGDALVSWLEDTSGGSEVRVRRVASSGQRGAAMAVARTSGGRPSGFPDMVRSRDRVVFTWREPDSPAGALIHTAVAKLAG